MKEIIKKVPMSVIVFHDKSVKFLETSKAEALFELATRTDSFKLDGSLYKFSAIAKIVGELEYYLQYPDTRPNAYSEIMEDNTGVVEKIYGTPKESRIRAIKGMISGLEGYISRQEKEPKNALLTLDRMKEKLREAELENI